MQKGICNLSVVPLRRIPSDKSEMVSQLLFGEIFTITDSMENWALIHNDFDGYEGWVDKKQFRILSEIETEQNVLNESSICTVPISSFLHNDGSVLHLSFGSILSNIYTDPSSKLDDLLHNNGDFQIIQEPDKTKVIAFAKQFTNAPYIWGGKSIFGVDCSGLVQLVFKAAGFQLPRDAGQQIDHGSLISFIEQAEPADLAFFDNDEGQIVHVGILLNQNQIIHASGKVRIDSIDHYGIFNHELHRYTHRLRIIKRV
jgi:cell wall-associated NlpC family hydrolase